MQCPVCAALNREHNHECEAEAKATLEQRAKSIGWHRGDTSTQDQVEQEVLRSRKRQAHLAFELDQHLNNHHSVKVKGKAAAG